MGTARSRIYGIEVDFLKDTKAFDFWYSKMPSYRKEKTDRIKPESGKRLSLGAGILLYTGLKELGIEGASVFYGENKKPYIDMNLESGLNDEGAGSLYFNLSHSGSMAVCAFSDSEVGIDIEQNKNFNDSLINYVFDENEAEFIRLQKEDITERNALFTSLWTMKESIMKYYGKGIAMGPKNIFIDQGKDLTVYYDGEPKKDIHLCTYTYKDYQICVCSDRIPFAESIEMFSY